MAPDNFDLENPRAEKETVEDERLIHDGQQEETYGGEIRGRIRFLCSYWQSFFAAVVLLLFVFTRTFLIIIRKILIITINMLVPVN